MWRSQTPLNSSGIVQKQGHLLRFQVNGRLGKIFGVHVIPLWYQHCCKLSCIALFSPFTVKFLNDIISPTLSGIKNSSFSTNNNMLQIIMKSRKISDFNEMIIQSFKHHTKSVRTYAHQNLVIVDVDENSRKALSCADIKFSTWGCIFLGKLNPGPEYNGDHIMWNCEIWMTTRKLVCPILHTRTPVH